MLIPVNIIPMTEEGMKEFNRIFYKCIKNTDLNMIERTPSGGIKKPCRMPCWDCIQTKNSVEITLIENGRMGRYQFRSQPYSKDIKTMGGRHAFSKFKKLCDKWKIDLDSMAIKDGKKIKESIDPPLITLSHHMYKNRIFENAHHVDFHSSYPAGLANTHKEFKQMLESLYSKRKNDDYIKAILNYTIGYLQSSYCKYKWAHLSKDAIEDNNMRLLKLANKIQNAGGIIILYNTDGFWYKMPKPYHDETEGSGLGQWHNDHVNCKFRARSDGCYEFIENGIYYPVVRGRTCLDEIKTRDKWQWGDIYHHDCKIVKFTFNKKEGISNYYEEEV